MKTQLLSFFTLISFLGYAQIDIEQLHSVNGSQFSVMSGTLDQSATGANVSWDFTNLSLSGVNLIDTYTDNGSTARIETAEGGTVISSVDLAQTMSQFSITGALSQGVQVTYTDSGLIGTFPLSFNYSNTDQVSGTFTSTNPALSGTIVNTSDIEVDVDAWGNLKVGNFDGQVTRLKVVQNLDFNALFQNFPGTITSYFYYDANSSDLVFRYTRVQASPPVVAPIDNELIEALSTYTLSTEQSTLSGQELRLTANPVTDVLRFDIGNTTVVKSITIIDVMGRKVKQNATSNNFLNVHALNSGLYIAVMETNRGTVSRRFIKE